MRILMWFAMGFALACGLGAGLWLGNLALGFAAAFFLLGLGLAIRHRHPHSGRAAAVLLGLAAGLVWFRVYDGLYLQPIRELDGKTLPVELTVTEFGQETDYGVSADGWVTVSGRPCKMRVYLSKTMEITPGDVLELDCRLRMTSDGGQQEPTYHRSNGIYLLGYQKGTVGHYHSERLPWYGIPAMLRQKMLSNLDRCMPERGAAFGKALLLGDTSGLDYETQTAFRVTGIAHLVAVSGLHVSILFSLLCLLVGRQRWVLLFTELPLLLLFAAAAGFPPSVVRAVTMQLLILLAMLANREYDPPTALAAAGLLMLLVNPLVITSVGFQLSFSATAGIFLFSRRITGWLEEPQRLGKKMGFWGRLRYWLAVSIGVTLGACSLTTPLVAWYFHTISLVNVLANVLVMWVISGLFCTLLLICILGSAVPPLGVLLGFVAAVPVDYVLGVIALLSRIPLAAVYTRSVYVIAWLIFVYVLLLLFLASRKGRPLVLLCCGILGLCGALLASWAELCFTPYEISVLDVGQGQCILVYTEGRSFLIDCGGDGERSIANLAAETLLSKGISRLDGLILTHFDRDHAGDAADFLTRIPTEVLYLPSASEDYPGAASVCIVDQDREIILPNSSLRLYRPELAGSNNESSLAVLYSYGDWDLLVMGDRTELAEKLLLNRTALPDVEVLVVGHHGSDTSTGEALLEAVRPETAVISVGADNRYGHPKEAVLERLEEFGCTIRRTDLDGTIVFGG